MLLRKNNSDLRGRISPFMLAMCVLALTSLGCKDNKNNNAKPVVTTDSPAARLSISFEDITNNVKLKQRYDNGESAHEMAILETIGGGAAVFDFDRDGFDDMYFASGGQLNNKTITGLGCELWRNLGGKEVTKITQEARAACPTIYTHGTVCGDVNNDGFSDLLVTGYYGLAVMINQGDGTFSEMSAAMGFSDPKWGTSAAFGDLNSDGNLDIYIAHYVDWSFSNHPPCKSAGLPDVCAPGSFTGISDVVWMSNGDGSFTRKSEEIGLVREGKGLGVLIADFTDDAKVEIYVANDTTNNFFYHNLGGTFEEIGLANGTAVDDMGTPQGSMGLCALDYDADLRLDLLVCNYENQAFALYKNDGDANFRYVTSTAGLMALGTTFVAWGVTATDFDADGAEELVIANGHVMSSSPPEQSPIFLQNVGKAKFQKYSFGNGGYFDKKWRGRGVLAFDFDRDGDLDLGFTHVNEDSVLLKNTTETDGNWWITELVGTTSNRDAIGARLVIKTNKRTKLRNVVGGGSYLSQNPYYVQWGLPKDETLESVEITWPSGIKQELTNLPPRSRTTIVEPVPSSN